VNVCLLYAGIFSGCAGDLHNQHFDGGWWMLDADFPRFHEAAPPQILDRNLENAKDYLTRLGTERRKEKCHGFGKF
jgi:hypothetical protein